MKKRGFTLIELLVVIAVIAVLLSVLIPSLKRAKDFAKRVVCATRLKQVGTGMKLYSDSYETLPDAIDNTGKPETGHGYAVYRADKPNWLGPDNKPLPLRWALLYVNDYIDVPEIFYCSGNRLDQYKYESYCQPAPWGTLDQDYNTKSGINQWVRIGYTYYPIPRHPVINSATNAPDSPKKFSQLHPILPYATDVLWGRANLSHQRMQSTDSAYHSSNQYSINALYADSHVSNCKDEDVFKNNIWDRFDAGSIADYDEYYYTVFKLVGGQ